MARQIVIEAETPGDSRTMFRLRIDANLIAEELTAVQAHILIGEILERIAVPKPSELAPLAPESDATPPPASLLSRGRSRMRTMVGSLFGRARPWWPPEPRLRGTPARPLFLWGKFAECLARALR
jgi:hypothetical protein